MASESVEARKPCTFFHASKTSEDGSLAILHLKRDSLLPVKLRSTADDGYAEGAVTNTRFGSFPHSTLIGLPWGSQVRASKVDTGTRGRKGKKALQQQQQQQEETPTERNGGQSPSDRVAKDGGTAGKKRGSKDHDDASPVKRLKQAPTGAEESAFKAPIEAGSGFIHILQPTPEAWTSSLDHRTQVVYSPDYSYILQRLRVRPGDTVIEAGAGSGSFTHAAARAVFNGYPDNTNAAQHGKVYSYEFHEPRVQTLQQEIHSHGLDGVIHLTRRDVCAQGFGFPENSISDTHPSVNAKAIFLDLPAPWLALPHLTRSTPDSPLHPDCAIHLCTFSPCIEQVMATVSTLRKAGWMEISMVEVQHKRLDVRRERVGLQEEGLRGVNASAANVAEAMTRLREVESKLSDFHAKREAESSIPSKHARLERIKKEAEERKLYLAGNLVHRTEPEVKTHTSYLVFAILPREWTEEDERRCMEKWSTDPLLLLLPPPSLNQGKAEEDIVE